MTALLFLSVPVQAGLLLWASIHLSNVVLRDAKLAAAAWAILWFGSALAISIYGEGIDVQQALCRPGDCAILFLVVAGVRVILMHKETEQLRLERELANRAAVAAAAAEQRAREAQQIVAVAATLESRTPARSAAPAASAPPGALPPSLSTSRLVPPPRLSKT